MNSFDVAIMLNKFADWWKSQPSDSGYPRFSENDGKNYLILWEGRGVYGYDFYDSSDYWFEKESFLGTNAKFFFTYQNDNVRVSFEGRIIGHYKSVDEFTVVAPEQWKKLQFRNHQRRDALAEKAKETILTAMEELVAKWKALTFFERLGFKAQARYGLVHQHGFRFHVALWQGNETDIWFGEKDYGLVMSGYDESDYDGRPRFRVDEIERYAGVRVEVDSISTLYHVSLMTYDRRFAGFISCNALEDLTECIRAAYKELRFEGTN